jgi:5'-nucleotidase
VRFLLTNDDGVLAPGLKSLARVAARFGEVVVVAPEAERSGVSHAITLTEPLRVRDLGCGWHALTGTPADCVFIGVHRVLGQAPDFVLSGVNRGPNLGHDVLYSGTVGAAMEAVLQGIPAVALSLVSLDGYPFEDAEPRVEALLRECIARGIPAGTCLNVNLPDASIAPFQGFRVTRLGRRKYSSDIWERTDPRGGTYLWIGGTRVKMDEAPDTDTGAVMAGWASITPLRPDLLAREAMQELAGFGELLAH